MKRNGQWFSIRVGLLAAACLLVMGVIMPLRVHAFNQNNLMDDYVFNQYTSMNNGQIDAFLNAKGSCISPNSGFSAPDPVGYSPSGGYRYGGNVTAGTVIAHAAQVYGINPQVLLATLQKEQSIIGSPSCSTDTIAKAMGYGCPDAVGSYSYSGVNLYTRNGTTYTSVGGTCVNSASKAGFSQQIIHAAWLFKFGQQRSVGNVGWAVVTGSWDNSDDLSSCYGGPMTQGTYKTCPNGTASYFDGYRTIDGTAVHMDTGATAALYWYTPHFHGNQNFVTIFTDYFGGTTGPEYGWSFVSVAVYADAARTQRISNPDNTSYVAPGQKIYVQLKAQNSGRLTWNGSAVRVGVASPRNRVSPFMNSDWIARDRAGSMTESMVRSGQIATFNFSLTAPSGRDIYYERFNLVYDGVSWITGADLWLPITVTSSVAPGGSGLSDRLTQARNTLRAGQHLLSTDLNSALTLLPDGNLVLYRDHRTVWSSQTTGSGAASLLMQSDGNLVLYRKDGQPVWATNTNGAGNTTYLFLQSDGNLVLYNNTGALWSTATNRGGDPNLRAISVMENGERMLREQALITPNRMYRLVLQSDGNLVLYTQSGTAVWASGTDHSGAYRAYMQSDGNLVLYTVDGRAVWASRTNGIGAGAHLVLQNDRNLVIYNSSTSVWSSNTHL